MEEKYRECGQNFIHALTYIVYEPNSRNVSLLDRIFKTLIKKSIPFSRLYQVKVDVVSV
jgi:hypothetical protein